MKYAVIYRYHDNNNEAILDFDTEAKARTEYDDLKRRYRPETLPVLRLVRLDPVVLEER